MFCTNCGKKIDDTAKFCSECGARVVRAAEKSAEAISEVPKIEEVEIKAPKIEEPKIKESEILYVTHEILPEKLDIEAKSYGKGRAVVAFVLGIVSFLMFYVYVAVVAAYEYGLAFLTSLVSYAPGIIAVIFGIKSIAAFKEMSSAGRSRPVATLVFGIIGLAFGAIGLFLNMIGVFVSCSLLITY